MKLSIIIPVYNAGRNLRPCVMSARVKGFDDWEMILVDDGSQDGSGKLCDKFAEEYRQIRVIHKENGGLSSARNVGLDEAKGRYIAFVDSDDDMQFDTLETIVTYMEAHPEYDIVEFPVVIDHYGPHARRLNFEVREYQQASDYWIDGEAYQHAYAWNKVYRRELFHNLRFPKGRVFEDVWTLPQLLKRARTVATTNVGLYFYNHNPKGITATAGYRGLNDLLEAHLSVLNYEPWLLEGKDIERYYAHVLNIQLDVYELEARREKGEERKEPRLPLMPFRGTFKLKMLQLLGMKRLCQWNMLMHKVVRHSR